MRSIAFALVVLLGSAPVLPAQTPSDTAAVILEVARALQRDGKIEASVVNKAIKDLGINPDKPNPAIS